MANPKKVRTGSATSRPWASPKSSPVTQDRERRTIGGEQPVAEPAVGQLLDRRCDEHDHHEERGEGPGSAGIELVRDESLLFGRVQER